MESIDLITNLGYPVAVSVILFYSLRGFMEKFIDMNEKAIALLERVSIAMERTERVIETNNKIQTKVETALDSHSSSIDEVRDLLRNKK